MVGRRTDGLYSSTNEDRARRAEVNRIKRSGDATALAAYFRDEHDAYLAHNGTTGKYLAPEERAMVDAVLTQEDSA